MAPRHQRQLPLQQQQSSSSVVGRYQVAVFFLIVLQATTMVWTTHSVHRQQHQMNSNSNNNNNAAADCGTGSDNSNNNNKQDFLSRSKASSSSSSSTTVHTRETTFPATSPRSGAPIDAPPQCSSLMTKFHDVNDRYRRGQTDDVSQPLINYVYYKSQGFGRLVDHATSHCILALALDRPCALDFSDRDPYYTWRHFIHTGTYDWEMTNHPLLQDLLPEVHQAISELHDIGDNIWDNKNPLNHTYTKIHLLKSQPDDWPPKPKRTLVKDFEKHLKAWRGENLPQAMLSPNWGNVWFPRLTFPEEFHGCNMLQLRALLQNALFQPTPLSLKLHHERLAEAMLAPPADADASSSAVVEVGAAPVNIPSGTVPKRKKINQEVNQQHALVTPRDDQQPYGAIHVRTVIVKTSRNGEERLQNLLPTLTKCLHHVRSVVLSNEDRKDITKWWILSDKPPVAVDLATNMTDFSLFHAYHLDDGFHDNNAHSALPSARGAFAHSFMAPSIADWLVLHESNVAVVTKGSFGDTGARGRGKYPRKVAVHDCDFFQVFY